MNGRTDYHQFGSTPSSGMALGVARRTWGDRDEGLEIDGARCPSACEEVADEIGAELGDGQQHTLTPKLAPNLGMYRVVDTGWSSQWSKTRVGVICVQATGGLPGRRTEGLWGMT